MQHSALNIVLIKPEIPQNTGNIGRTCIGLGATLHLVGKPGFSMDESAIRRAGLDYWPKLKYKNYSDWETFLATLPADADLNFFSTHGTRSYWGKTFKAPCYLLFGSESKGFPPDFYERYKEKLLRIPVTKEIRSLNLATAVGVAAFEVVRQFEAVQQVQVGQQGDGVRPAGVIR